MRGKVVENVMENVMENLVGKVIFEYWWIEKFDGENVESWI